MSEQNIEQQAFEYFQQVAKNETEGLSDALEKYYDYCLAFEQNRQIEIAMKNIHEKASKRKSYIPTIETVEPLDINALAAKIEAEEQETLPESNDTALPEAEPELPNMKWSKHDIQDYLKHEGIGFPSRATKEELLNLLFNS